MRYRNAFTQLEYFIYEAQQGVNKRPWRWFTMWFGGGICVNASYRLDRFLYLLIGRAYVVLRPLLFPLFLCLRLLSSSHEIHYRADIGKGLKILHPNLGVVISAHAVCGRNLVLTGGNCIGGRGSLSAGDIQVGHNVQLGANAVILGPIRVGDDCVVGAGAVVIKDAPSGSTLVGVPAHVLASREVSARGTT